MIEDDNATLPCVGKLAYDSKKQADTASVVAKHQHNTDVSAYLCQYCGLWHLKSDYKT